MQGAFCTATFDFIPFSRFPTSDSIPFSRFSISDFIPFSRFSISDFIPFSLKNPGNCDTLYTYWQGGAVC